MNQGPWEGEADTEPHPHLAVGLTVPVREFPVILQRKSYFIFEYLRSIMTLGRGRGMS